MTGAIPGVRTDHSIVYIRLVIRLAIRLVIRLVTQRRG